MNLAEACLREAMWSKREGGRDYGSQIGGIGELPHIEDRLLVLVPSHDDHNLGVYLKGGKLRLKRRCRVLRGVRAPYVAERR